MLGTTASVTGQAYVRVRKKTSVGDGLIFVAKQRRYDSEM